MSEIIGRDLEVGFAVEETRGTAQVSAEKWAKRSSASVIVKAEHTTDDNTTGVIEDSESRIVTKKWCEGTLETTAQADMIGYILYNLYGSVTSSIVSGSVYQHIFAMQQSIQHPSLSIFIKDGSVAQKVFDTGMVKTFELNATTDDLVRMKTEFQARNETANSDTPSYDTEYDFIGKDITVKFADTLVGLDEADATEVKDLTITFDAGTILDYVLGDYKPQDIFNSRFSIEGSFTKNFIDATWKDLFRNDSAKYVSITIEGSADIGGANHPKIELILYKLMVTDWSRSSENDDIVTEDVSFKAFYNTSDSKQSQLTIQNLTVEYDSAPTS